MVKPSRPKSAVDPRTPFRYLPTGGKQLRPPAEWRGRPQQSRRVRDGESKAVMPLV